MLQPLDDSFSKKRKVKVEVDPVDEEIIEMKNMLKEAIQNITVPTEVNKSDDRKEENVYAQAILKALKQVPNQNIFDCIIKINEIINKYKNMD